MEDTMKLRAISSLDHGLHEMLQNIPNGISIAQLVEEREFER